MKNNRPHIRIVPEFHKKPEIAKLARALLSVANKQAEQERTKNRKGDTVT